MPAIDIKGLTKRYGANVALAGIDFHVDRGETFALLGPNGAGKTSTIEILEGYRARDGGQVSVLGLDPARDGRHLRKKIGLVLQSTALEPELTVAETVRAFARAYPRALSLDEVIEQVDLTHTRGRRVKALSGGQQRRLEIALGIIGNPQVIFLDEPTTGLDPDARRKIWRLIHALNAQGKTIVMSSHYMDEVRELASRIAILVEGRLRATGTPDELQLRFSPRSFIRFTVNGEMPSDFPSGLRRLMTRTADTVEIAVEDPVPVLAELTAWAAGTCRDLTNFTVSRASLEDIYLQLTGSKETKSDAADP